MPSTSPKPALATRFFHVAFKAANHQTHTGDGSKYLLLTSAVLGSGILAAMQMRSKAAALVLADLLGPGGALAAKNLLDMDAPVPTGETLSKLLTADTLSFLTDWTSGQADYSVAQFLDHLFPTEFWPKVRQANVELDARSTAVAQAV